MIDLKYELKSEKTIFEDEEFETEYVEITAETSFPNTPIVFKRSGKTFAKTNTDNNGVGICGFSIPEKAVTVRAEVDGESESIKIKI